MSRLHKRKKAIEAKEKEEKLRNKAAWKKHFKEANSSSEHPAIILNFATEKQCRAAVTAQWKRTSQKRYGEILDPKKITDPDIKKYYEYIKKQTSAKYKIRIALEIREYTEKILNDLPNLPKWITNNPKIIGQLKNTKFLNVLNYIRTVGGIEQRLDWSRKWTNVLN